MEWQIKSIARKSAHSEVPFEPGDRVACIIYKDEANNEVGRVDLLASEVDAFKPDGPVLGRWNRVVKHPDEEASSAKETMASAEDLFLSLYDTSVLENDVSANALKHILALMLERKRVLRSIGRRPTSGVQTYLHVKQKRNLDVPIVEMSAELMLNIQESIGELIL